MVIKRVTKTALGIGAVFFIMACAEDPLEKKIAQRMSEAEIYLKDGNYVEAMHEYKYILDRLNSNYAPAMLGYILSDTMTTFETLSDTISMLSSLLVYILPQSSPPLSEKQSTGINKVLKEFLENLIIGTFRRALDCSDKICFDKIEEQPNFEYKVESLPIKVKEPLLGSTVLDLDFGGSYNLGEAYFLEAMFSGILGIAEILYTIDFQLDVLGLVGFFSSSNIMDEINKTPLIGISKLLAVLLNKNSNFLKYNGSNEDLENSKNHLINAFDSEISSINDLIENTQGTIITRDPDEPPTKEKAGYFHFKFINNIPKPTTVDVKIKVSPELTKSLENIKNNLYSSGGAKPISWAQDLAPLLAILFQTVIDSGIAKNIIDMVMSFIGSDISEESKAMLEQVLGFLKPGTLSADVLTGLLTSIIPDVLEIDGGRMYSSPPDIRDWLPVWTKFDTYSKYPTSSTDALWLEWECGATTIDMNGDGKPDINTTLDTNLMSLVCNDPTKAIDSEHFALNLPLGDGAKITPIKQDGTPSIFPYFYIKDPTFSSSIFIKLDPNPCGTDTGFHIPKDNCEINTLIQNIFTPILNLLKPAE